MHTGRWYSGFQSYACRWEQIYQLAPTLPPLSVQSCYEHIQKEDMRLHRLPCHWDARELW